MSDFSATERKEPTVHELVEELASLRNRVEDLEAARELDAAIQRNGDKPLIAWEQVSKDLGL